MVTHIESMQAARKGGKDSVTHLFTPLQDHFSDEHCGEFGDTDGAAALLDAHDEVPPYTSSLLLSRLELSDTQSLLHRNVQRFRGGLVFKAHRHSPQYA